MSDRRGPDRSARRADPQHPGASDRASLVARLGRAGQPEAPGRRRTRRQESMGFAPQDRRDCLRAGPGGTFLSQDRGAGSLGSTLIRSSRSFPPCLSVPLNEPDMSSADSVPRAATACARGPLRAESTSPPLVAPLELSVVYCPADLDHVDALNSGEASGFIYARDGHPNAAELALKALTPGGWRGGLGLRLGHGCDRRGLPVAA